MADFGIQAHGLWGFHGPPWKRFWHACMEHHPKLILIYMRTRCCRCKGCTDRQCAERRGGHAFDWLTRMIVLLLTWLEESRISMTSTDMARERHAISKMQNFVSRRRLHAIFFREHSKIIRPIYSWVKRMQNDTKDN